MVKEPNFIHLNSYKFTYIEHVKLLSTFTDERKMSFSFLKYKT